MPVQKCIWMECGYIEYKLCDRNYDCENCPFDKAIHEKNRSAIEKNIEQVKSYLEPKNSNVEESFITKNHIWLRKTNDGFVLGIDDFIQKILRRNIKFHLPEPKTLIKKNRAFLWLTGDFGGFSFPAPFDGIVETVNYELIENPFLFFDTNSFQIELIEVIPEVNPIDFLSTEILIEYDNYHNFITNEKILVNNFLNKKTHDYRLGITIYDGGDIKYDVIQNFSNETYLQLLKLLINK